MAHSVIEMLLPENDPNGLRIVKLAGWIGRAFVIPRADIKKINTLKEAAYPAVYFLFGEGEDKPLVYIGQTDNFMRRLNQQTVAKDYWNIALVFTGETDIDVQYIERQCVQDAERAGRYQIKNSTGTPGRSVSDFQRASNDAFFENIKFITAILNYPLFESAPRRSEAQKIYYFKTDAADASGALLDTGEFVVFGGSSARVLETPSFVGRGGSGLRKRLETVGVLRLSNSKSFTFTRDYIFTSPSAAGDTVAGRSVNGWTAWKDKEGSTLDEIVRK